MSAALTPEKVAARLEDIRFLLDHGEPTDRIARRLGLSRVGLEAFLRRHGHTELARHFNRDICHSRDAA